MRSRIGREFYAFRGPRAAQRGAADGAREQVAQGRWSAPESASTQAGGFSTARIRRVRSRAALGGERDQLDAAIALGTGWRVGQALLFEAVDDAGDVGVVAVQEGGDLAHRPRLVEHAQGAEGGRPQAELAGDREERRRVDEAGEQAPGLAGGGSARRFALLRRLRSSPIEMLF